MATKDRITVNLDDYSDFPEPLEPGKYVCILDDVEDAVSKQGNQMYVWDWEVIEGEKRGRTARSWTVTEEGKDFSFVQHLKGFGLSGELDDFKLKDLVGRKALLTITRTTSKDDTGEERVFANVKRVDPIEGGGAKPKVRRERGKADKAKDDVPV